MKDLMLKVFSLLLFDCNVVIIPAHCKEHNNHSSRWILISRYWFRRVPLHFTAISLLGLLGLALFVRSCSIHPAAITISSLIAFPILILSFYTPQFTAIFLPELYKVQQKQLEQHSTELEKCRKTQLPNPTLVLIWYVLDKTSGINAVKHFDDYTGLLNQLFGVDPRSLKTSMEFFFGSSRKRNQLKGRARTELENRFAEAYQFFEALHFEKAVPILQELETKCFSKMD
ncbi:hypothetical protein DC498_22070 [Terrimonas sp.]|uniref:hypothetical protein n=1 Tax=Terrimonas sp. TaxID=1914338 RepID=UPI000D507206|nr:hypothetical protein [Terrimonas sp.]PVD50011.1 hypothetical protein DC498_22070 [Terrimonas sp.]